MSLFALCLSPGFNCLTAFSCSHQDRPISHCQESLLCGLLNQLLCGLIIKSAHREGAFPPLTSRIYLLWKKGWLNSCLLLKISREKVTHDRAWKQGCRGLYRNAPGYQEMWFFYFCHPCMNVLSDLHIELVSVHVPHQPWALYEQLFCLLSSTVPSSVYAVVTIAKNCTPSILQLTSR